MILAPKQIVFTRFDCQTNFSWKTTEQQADGAIDLQDVKSSWPLRNVNVKSPRGSHLQTDTQVTEAPKLQFEVVSSAIADFKSQVNTHQ